MQHLQALAAMWQIGRACLLMIRKTGIRFMRTAISTEL